ncbi:hypothetical protein HDU76_005053 [Blyttiomyces sp. JEL0837]|nr:hypothetical protein HDU76_005053 [Blyttiomyces sp. JEL0837]
MVTKPDGKMPKQVADMLKPPPEDNATPDDQGQGGFGFADTENVNVDWEPAKGRRDGGANGGLNSKQAMPPNRPKTPHKKPPPFRFGTPSQELSRKTPLSTTRNHAINKAHLSGRKTGNFNLNNKLRIPKGVDFTKKDGSGDFLF